MHADQMTVPGATVRALIAEQFPPWQALPVRRIASQGTVNAIFRIGDDLAARFPLRPGDAEGVVATDEDPGESAPFAHDLAAFIRDVRAIGTRGRTFRGTGRGGDLQSHDAWLETCFSHSEELLDVPRLRRLWDRLRDLPRGTHQDVMTHGDLIPGNVLVRDGHLAGVLDVGGLGPADPALDLVAAWHLLEAGPRQSLRDDLGCGDLEWERGQAWAFEQAMGVVWYYAETNPAMSRMGRTTLERILADSRTMDE
jgi:aminoglycoside phosphotransferase (APT) family kinase protein